MTIFIQLAQRSNKKIVFNQVLTMIILIKKDLNGNVFINPAGSSFFLSSTVPVIN